MFDPYKIIYKVKNNNKEYQYYLYIFIGYNINDKLKNILNKIKDLDFYNTLIKLDINEYKYIEKYYGKEWYNKIFIKNHIEHTFENIIKNNLQFNELSKKYGKDWLNDNINLNKLKKIKVMYNFNDSFKLLYEKKTKITKLIESDINYDDTNQKGGDQEDVDEVENEDNSSDIDNIIQSNSKLTLLSDEEKLQVDESDEFDIDELDIMNKNIETVDKNLEQNIKLVNKLIDNDENDNINLNNFDNSKDDIQYEDNLKNTYKKIYIFNQYIYNDDTIINIKKKISCSIGLNSKFINKTIPILPSRQYIFSEYDYQDPKTKKKKNLI